MRPGLGWGLRDPCPGQLRDPSSAEFCTHITLLLTGFRQQARSPPCCAPLSRRVSGSSSSLVSAVAGQGVRSLHWDAALGGSPQGEGEERGSAVGKHWGAQHAPGISIPPNASHPGDDSILWQGGCKVPTCFMAMHSTVGEGDLSIGSAARCAQTFLSRHPRTHISGRPHSRRDLVRSHISNDSPQQGTRAPGCTWAVHSIAASPWSCPELSCPPVGTPGRSTCHSPTGTSGQMLKQGSWETHGEPFRKTLPAVLLPKDFLRGFAFISLSLSCKLKLFQPRPCPVVHCLCEQAARRAGNCLLSSLRALHLILPQTTWAALNTAKSCDV